MTAKVLCLGKEKSQVMDFSFSELNFNSIETLPGFEARAAFSVNSSSVFKEDVDIVPIIVDDTLSYIPRSGDSQMPFDLLALVEKAEIVYFFKIRFLRIQLFINKIKPELYILN